VLWQTSPAQLSFLRNVATSIPHFVPLEVRTIDTLGRFGFLATFWHWALVTVIWMETVIHVPLEVASAVKPWASAVEGFPVKPFRAVIAGGRTAVRIGVIVTIGTVWRCSDLNGDLGLCFGTGGREADCSNGS